MNFWKLSPWLSRLIILAVAALFAIAVVGSLFLQSEMPQQERPAYRLLLAVVGVAAAVGLSSCYCWMLLRLRGALPSQRSRFQE